MSRGYRSLLFLSFFTISHFIAGTLNAEETGQTGLKNPASDSSVIIERSGKESRLLKADVAFCQEITDKRCVNVATTFSIDAARIFCHTTIFGAKTYMEIRHKWHHDGKIDQIVRLPVKSTRWRTWSLKTLSSGAEGSWRIEVYAGDLKIGEGEFTVLEQEPIVSGNE